MSPTSARRSSSARKPGEQAGHIGAGFPSGPCGAGSRGCGPAPRVVAATLQCLRGKPISRSNAVGEPYSIRRPTPAWRHRCHRHLHRPQRGTAISRRTSRWVSARQFRSCRCAPAFKPHLSLAVSPPHPATSPSSKVSFIGFHHLPRAHRDVGVHHHLVRGARVLLPTGRSTPGPAASLHCRSGSLRLDLNRRSCCRSRGSCRCTTRHRSSAPSWAAARRRVHL
jgi:hypothetical protein